MMRRALAGLALACLLWPLPALAGPQTGAQPGQSVVILDNSHELRQGYCQGTVSAEGGGNTTVAIEACANGGISGIAPGDTHAFPEADVRDAKQGLAVADARKRYFATPFMAAILHGSYMPGTGDDLKPMATLAGQAELPDWQAFIGIMQPIVDLGEALHRKPIAAYNAEDFRQASDAYDSYAKAETAAITAYAAVLGKLHVAGPRHGPGLAAGILVQAARSGYNLPFAPAMPDAWLTLQEHAARTGAGILATYRRSLTPLGLPPFSVSELQRQEQIATHIRQQAEHTYATAAEQTATGVLNDAEYKKTDPQILADIEQALAPYTRGRAAAIKAAKAQIARERKLIAFADRIVVAMHGQHWQLTIAETDGDPVRHYTMALIRTGMHAFHAKVYERDIQNGKPIYMYTWPVNIQPDGGVMINSAVNGLDNAFAIPAKAFSSGHFHVLSEGFTELFHATGELVPQTGDH